MTEERPPSVVTHTAGIDEYALVAYVPPPLGPYLDRMRRELSPWMPPGRSHVTLLSPRPLNGNARAVRLQILRSIQDVKSFTVQAKDIELFDSTKVIYLSVGKGFDTLVGLHRELNRRQAGIEEPVIFHPHITLGRARESDEVEELTARAQVMWRNYTNNQHFTIEKLYFVQNTVLNLWIDLEALELSQPEKKDQSVGAGSFE